MKTIQDIKITIEEISKETLKHEFAVTEKEKKALQREINARNESVRLLRDVIIYLESNPTEGFVIRQKERCEMLIRKAKSMHKENNPKYNKKVDESMDIPNIKKQLNVLNCIL